MHCSWMLLKLEMKNRERGTGNKERGTGNWEQDSGNKCTAVHGARFKKLIVFIENAVQSGDI